MSNNIKIGQIGEDLACEYLLTNKYRIIDRNYRETWGEIDIIAKDKNGVLVFVEVKALKVFHANVKHSDQGAGLKPEDNLSRTKLEKVKRTAYLYANSHPKLVDDKKGWQIDLIAIEIYPRTQLLGEGVNHSNPETLNQKELAEFSTIRHYEGIVD